MSENASPENSEAPVRVGPYTVEDAIGVGPHGAVYRVSEVEQGGELALKRLHKAIAGEKPGETFNRIARVVVALAHPAIADVSHVALHAGHVVIISELVGARSLAQVLEDRGPLSPSETVGLARQLAIALEYAHQRSVFHTSLRPENVFLTSDGAVRITDFAIAALYGHSVRQKPSYQVTQQAFLAPEFLEGGVISQQTDIFSLGAVLFMALTGTPPGISRAASSDGRFSYLEVGGKKAAPVALSAPNFEALPPETPQSLRQAIASALEREPAKRPGYVKAFQQLLREVKAAPLTELAEGPGEETQEHAASGAAGARVRLCPACRRPVSPAGRVCLACGLVLTGEAGSAECAPVNYFHEHARRLLSKHDLGAAERAYRSAIGRNPDEAVLYDELGDVLGVENNFAEAADAYRHAVKLDPQDADAWHDLGLVLLAAHNHGEARRALERAVKLGGNKEVRLSARIHLGALAAEEGRVQEATAAWQQVLHEEPGLVVVRMALASLYANTGLYEEAEQQLRAALVSEPDYRQAQNLLARIRERAQLERPDTDERFGLADDLGGGSTHLGIGFDWGRWG